MQPLLDTAFDAKSSKGNELVSLAGLTILHHSPESVKPGRLRLVHVKVLGRSHPEADVAFKVAWFVVLTLLAGSVLREVFGCSHDKLELVER